MSGHSAGQSRLRNRIRPRQPHADKDTPGATSYTCVSNLLRDFHVGRRKMIDAFVQLSDWARHHGADPDEITRLHGLFFDGNVEIKDAYGPTSILAELWLSEAKEAAVLLHVKPHADVVAHDDTEDCVCGPRSEAVARADGSVGWVIVHHALDGRS